MATRQGAPEIALQHLSHPLEFGRAFISLQVAKERSAKQTGVISNRRDRPAMPMSPVYLQALPTT
jgi:hypothetical protein